MAGNMTGNDYRTILDWSNQANLTKETIPAAHPPSTPLIQFVHAMRFWRTLLIPALVFTLSLEILQAQKKKHSDEEEETQTLELPKDPPQAVAVAPQRLGFLTAPLTSKGLLSQQVRDGLKSLRKLARGAAIVKIRTSSPIGSSPCRRSPPFRWALWRRMARRFCSRRRQWRKRR